MKEYASIFNDVLGPIMIGPSSSHTAASVRIGQTLADMVTGKITYFQVDLDPEGSLAPSLVGQCVDIGLIGGLLKMDATHKDLVNSIKIAEEGGMKINFNVVSFENNHPNTYKMIVKNDQNELITATALSVGGGMMEFIEINGAQVSMKGGYYETLLFGDNLSIEKESLAMILDKHIDEFCLATLSANEKQSVVNLKTRKPISDLELEWFKKQMDIENIITSAPVLPIVSQKTPDVPFTSASEMIELANKSNQDLADMALLYESERGGISQKEVYQKAEHIVDIMKKGIETGLAKTEYHDRMLGAQAYKMFEENDKLIGQGLTTRIIGYITAMMETKSSMNVFVAAPTAGSCALLPGTLLAVKEEHHKSKDDLIRALLAAGIIGVFIAEKATFAAEVGGCQAECGSGSGMCGAALVQLMGGSIKQAVAAASMSLQNVFGMVCDPVAMRVEVPCLGKNVLTGMNALGAANMALANFDEVISFDETLASFNEVCRMLPSELRCTGGAGLATTKTGLEIAEKLKDNSL